MRAGLWVQLDPLTRTEVYYRVLRARYVAGGAWSSGSGRVLLDTAAFPSASVSFETVLYRDAADPDPLSCYVLDTGTNDAGDVGAEVAGSRVSTSSTTKVRVRSGDFSIMSGDRFNAGCTSQRYITSGVAVISL
jgi:hypothetical protein